ncbi:MAG: hypothetical protein J5830_02990 [Clostridia bacterium]|nr:hypothetical protein [Clostridia bacterium]
MFYRPERNRFPAAAVCVILFALATASVVIPKLTPLPEAPFLAALMLALSVIIMVTDRYLICDVFYTVDGGYFCAARTGRGIVFRRSAALISDVITVKEWKELKKSSKKDGIGTGEINLLPDLMPKKKIVVVFRFGDNLTGVLLQGGDDLRNQMMRFASLDIT